ncbi:hypothetical protein [Streptomyces sp. NPDC086519]|uniref:hypothetical protein n=1 Tax=Streptomyces sp. NPDC086519 TaxID=3154863 RepID=UPI0034427CEE
MTVREETVHNWWFALCAYRSWSPTPPGWYVGCRLGRSATSQPRLVSPWLLSKE